MTAPAPTPAPQAAPAAPPPNPVPGPSVSVGVNTAIPAVKPSAPSSNAAQAATATAQPLSPSVANVPVPLNGQMVTAQQAADAQAQQAAVQAEQTEKTQTPAAADTPLNDQLIERWNAQLDSAKLKGASTPNMLPQSAYNTPGKTIAPSNTPYNPFKADTTSNKLWSFGMNAVNSANLMRRPPGRFDNVAAPHLRGHPWIQATAGHMAEMPGNGQHPLAALVGNVLGPQLGEFVGQQVQMLPNYVR